MIRATRALVRQFSLDYMGLVETKIGDPQAEICRIGFHNFIFSPSRGLSGSLALAWSDGFEFEVLFVDHSIIQ